MTKYSQEEYLQFAINYLWERNIIADPKIAMIAVRDLNSNLKWEIVSAYQDRKIEKLTNLIKTNTNI